MTFLTISCAPRDLSRNGDMNVALQVYVNLCLQKLYNTNMASGRSNPASAAQKFSDFGALLKYLRRRAGLSQRDLALAVGYSEAQISRLEHNRRPPEFSMLEARFVPALELEEEPALLAQLLSLARKARAEANLPAVILDEMEGLEIIPPPQAGEVPRPQAFQRLRGMLESAQSVLLHGFSGVGKSTLAAALARAAQDTRPVFWHTVSNLHGSPFETFIRRLALFLTLQGRTEAALLLRPGDTARERHITSLAAHLRACRPLICVDEFHRMQTEPEALALLERLIQESQSAFLLISREDFPLKNTPAFLLNGLSQEEAGVLLRQMGLRLPEELFASLYHLTQGNPMLLRLAAARMIQQPTSKADFLKGLATQGEVVSFLTQTALDGLPSQALNLLSLLSILRTPINLFDAHLAERLRQAGQVEDLPAAILALQRRHFLDNPAQAGLHPLLQEHFAAFLHTRPEFEQRLHNLAADWLRLTPHNIIGALYHYVQARNYPAFILLAQDSLKYLDTSGQSSAAVESIDTLLNYLASAPVKPPRQEWQLSALRGQLLMHGARAAEAEADLRRALALALRHGAAADETARLNLLLARLLLQRSKTAEALELCEQAERLIQAKPSPALLAQTLAVEANAYLMQARLDEAWSQAEKALEQAALIAHQEFTLAAGARTTALTVKGIIARIRGDVPGALTFWRQAEESALLAGDTRSTFRCRANSAALLFDEGELEEARQAYEKILEAVQGIGDLFTLGRILNALGSIHYLEAQPARALEYLEKAKQLKQLIGDLQGEATTENQRAQVLLSLGKPEEARRVVERLLRQTEETGEMRWRAAYLDTLGQTLLAMNDFTSAGQRFQEALALPGVEKDPPLTLYLSLHLTLALLGNEELDQARALFDRCAMPGKNYALEAEYRLVQALLQRGGKPDVSQATLCALEEWCRAHFLFLYAQSAAGLRAALSEEGATLPKVIPYILIP